MSRPASEEFVLPLKFACGLGRAAPDLTNTNRTSLLSVPLNPSLNCFPGPSAFGIQVLAGRDILPISASARAAKVVRAPRSVRAPILPHPMPKWVRSTPEPEIRRSDAPPGPYGSDGGSETSSEDHLELHPARSSTAVPKTSQIPDHKYNNAFQRFPSCSCKELASFIPPAVRIAMCDE